MQTVHCMCGAHACPYKALKAVTGEEGYRNSCVRLLCSLWRTGTGRPGPPGRCTGLWCHSRGSRSSKGWASCLDARLRKKKKEGLSFTPHIENRKIVLYWVKVRHMHTQHYCAYSSAHQMSWIEINWDLDCWPAKVKMIRAMITGQPNPAHM